MFFYVYLHPEVISIARQNGALGLQVLISILRGFLPNCFIAEFQDYRVQEAIKEELDKLDDDFDRKLIKEIFRVMEKRNRFVYCLVPDYASPKSDDDTAKEQAEEAMLDLLLLVDQDDDFEMVEIATLFDYQHSEFEAVRSKLVAEGLTLAADGLAGKEVLDLYLKKALR